MHDPMTLAFTIPNPFTFRRVSWKSTLYAEPLIEIWHVDPERHGDDDSCDWRGSHSLTDEDREWLRKEGKDQHQWFFRGILKYDDKPDGTMVENTRGERWPGGMVHASSFEVLMGIASVIFWTMPVKGKKMHERWFSSWRLRRALAQALPTLLGLCIHSSDNVHSQVVEARACNDAGAKALGELFVCVARNLRQEARPWYKHPKWHIHHWSVRCTPLRNLRNWVTRRCADCGQRLPYGYTPVYDSNGYHHLDCTARAMRAPPGGSMISTKERLAKELEAVRAPKAMITAARAGCYDDFESASGTPISDLVRDLTQAGYAAMAQRARDGEFDATPEEAQAWADQNLAGLLPDRTP